MSRIATTLLLITASCAFAGEAVAPKPVAPATPTAAPAAATPGTLTLADLPAAVRSAFEQQADGAVVERIRIDERNGEKTYSARWTRADVRSEARIAGDGKILKLTAKRNGKGGSVGIDRLPEAARTIVTSRVGDGRIVEVQEEVEKGVVTYEVDIERSDAKVSIEFDAAGQIEEERTRPIRAVKKDADKDDKDEKGDKDDKGHKD